MPTTYKLTTRPGYRKVAARSQNCNPNTLRSQESRTLDKNKSHRREQP